MRKALNIILVLLFLMSSSFAFDVFDESGTERTYYNLANNDILIKTSQNVSLIYLSYESVNSTIRNNYSLYSCYNLFCADISIAQFISNNGLNLVSSKYTIEVGTDMKNVYLDIEDPEFSISNSFIDKATDELKIYFNYSDNFEVKSLAIYEEVGNNLIFLQNISSNSYVRKVDSTGSYDLLFRTFDISGNSKDYSETFYVDDIFEPKILETFVTINENDMDFYFKVSDNNLARYELTQNALKLSGTISSSTYEDTISLPFKSGSFIFTIFDTEENSVSKNIELKNPFSNSYEKKYSKDNKYQFTSSANNCFLLKVGAENYNDEFDKDGKNFEIELEVIKSRKYDLSFYCENDEYRVYYEKDFFFDNNPPTIPTLNLKALDTGEIEINWDESTDNETENIEYILYKNSEKVFTGTKLKFKDTEVSFPNEYEYYLRVVDEAGNKVDTEKKKITPSKTDILLQTNLEGSLTVKSNLTTIEINTDIGSDIDILVKNGNFLVHSENMKVTNTKSSFNIPLINGTNEIKIKVNDEFGNSKEQIILLTYDEPAPKFVAPVVELVSEVNESVVLEDEKPNTIPEGASFWIWLMFWIIVISLFLWFFIFNENKLKTKMSFMNKRNSRNKRNNQNDLSKHILERRNRDKALERNLSSVNKDRDERSNERDRIIKHNEEKSKRPLSEFEKRKLADLSSSKNNSDSFLDRRHFDRPMKEKSEPKVKPKRSNFFTALFSVFKSKPKEEVKDDPMSRYLQRQRNSRSWDHSNSYRQSFHDSRKEKLEKEKRDKENEHIAKEVEKEHARKAALRQEELKNRKEEEKSNFKHGIVKRDKLSLDDYLNKRTKKKRFLFAEREVDRDLRSRR